MLRCLSRRCDVFPFIFSCIEKVQMGLVFMFMFMFMRGMFSRMYILLLKRDCNG